MSGRPSGGMAFWKSNIVQMQSAEPVQLYVIILKDIGCKDIIPCERSLLGQPIDRICIGENAVGLTEPRKPQVASKIAVISVLTQAPCPSNYFSVPVKRHPLKNPVLLY